MAEAKFLVKKSFEEYRTEGRTQLFLTVSPRGMEEDGEG